MKHLKDGNNISTKYIWFSSQGPTRRYISFIWAGFRVFLLILLTQYSRSSGTWPINTNFLHVRFISKATLSSAFVVSVVLLYTCFVCLYAVLDNGHHRYYCCSMVDVQWQQIHWIHVHWNVYLLHRQFTQFVEHVWCCIRTICLSRCVCVWRSLYSCALLCISAPMCIDVHIFMKPRSTYILLHIWISIERTSKRCHMYT